MNIRHLDKQLTEHISARREILVLLGARQVGKTTIVKRLFPEAVYLTADAEPVRMMLQSFDPAVYRQYIPKDANLVVLDEIHLLSDPGRAAKIFFDLIPEIKVIATGSSAFSIKNKATESLAGRKIEYRLYPLSVSEYLLQKGITTKLSYPFFESISTPSPIDSHSIIDTVLIYGLYPKLISQPNDTAYLANLVDSVVFRDLFDLSLIENRVAAGKLLKILAFQIGSLVNYASLAAKTGLDVKTVKRYLTLFEQSFIVFPLYPYSKRKSLEVVKSPKYYFYDTGLRNALIGDFSPVDIRPDAGALWENFVVSEIFKSNYYGGHGYWLHFWRTAQGSEMDVVLTKGDELIGIEIKTSPRRLNTAFGNRYPHARCRLVTKENFLTGHLLQ